VTDDAFADAAAKATPARAQMIALLVVLAATETHTSVNTWRQPSRHIVAYFEALARWGYPLSEVEALIVAEREANAGDAVDDPIA